MSADGADSPTAGSTADGGAMMPPPTGATRTSRRVPKPTLKMRTSGYNEDDYDEDEEDDDDDYEASSGKRRSSRARIKPALKSASSAGATPTTASYARPARVKLSLKSGHQFRGRGDPTLTGINKTVPYMHGYDRELDSSDEETGEGMAFEEQIILRMPEGHEATKRLGEWVRRREVGNDGREVELKFKDSRRAVFKLGEQMFSSKLVDLPAIIETHKTLDNKQLFKIADISQMLLVTNEVGDEADVTRGQGTQVDGLTDDFVYDHGITPPMKWARKRRFRKRIHKRTIETVEKEVERLLAEDERAEKIEYHMIDTAEADMSDSDDEGGGGRRRRHGRESSMMGDGASTIGDGEDQSQLGDFDDMSVAADDDDVDQDLQRELEQEMFLQQQQDDDEEEEEEEDYDETSSAGGRRRARNRSMSRATSEEDDEEEDDEEDDDDLFDAGGDVGAAASTDVQPTGDTNTYDDDDDDDDLDEDEAERRVREQQLEAECREIEAMVKRKQIEVNATANALIKQRNTASLKRIQTELDMKRSQLSDLKRQRREGKEAARAEAQAQAEEAAAAAAATAAATASEAIPAEADEDAEADNDVGTARQDRNTANAAAASQQQRPGKGAEGTKNASGGAGGPAAATSGAGSKTVRVDDPEAHNGARKGARGGDDNDEEEDEEEDEEDDEEGDDGAASEESDLFG